MDKTLPQEQQATSAPPVLASAIVIAAPGVFGVAMPGAGHEAGPLTVVGGLPLFVRVVLTLQRAGVQDVTVVAGDDELQLKRALAGNPKVTVPVRWRPIREFPADDHKTWDALAHEMKGACLVVGAQMVLSRQLIEVLAREAAADAGALTVVCDGRATDLAVMQPELLRVATPIKGEGPPFRVLLGRAQADGLVTAIETSAESRCWCLRVDDRASAQAAERKLFAALRGQYEGFVDTYFNRAVSAQLSRIFLALHLSPNAITLVATAVGMLAAVFFSTGSYAAGIVGALLFQLSAIIDCCDGEVARLTFTESPFGEQLDIMTDNLVHMAIFAAIGLGAFRAYGGWNGSGVTWLPLALGGAAVFANIVSLWLVTRAKAIQTRNAWRTPEQAARAEFILKNMASRDFSVILLIFAVIGRLDWFLCLTAIGSNLFWPMLAWVTRPSAIVSRA